jgi:predicted DNA-binding protein (MmcQ/YjbR family)
MQALDLIQDHCLSKSGVEAYFPFGPENLVFKVAGKMFLIVSLDEDPLRMNVKCDPELVEERRANYPSVLPGYHMNKTHWNTVILDGSIPMKTLRAWIDESYELIRASLPKKLRDSL